MAIVFCLAVFLIIDLLQRGLAGQVMRHKITLLQLKRKIVALIAQCELWRIGYNKCYSAESEGMS